MKRSTISGASGSHERHASDFYETPAEFTVALMDFLRLSKNEVIYEPACGDGEVCEVLWEYKHHVVFSDIRSTKICPDEDETEDFLSEENRGYEAGWIITNPPFNLAEKFIRKALSLTSNVAMLLKATYWHSASRSGLFNESPPAGTRTTAYMAAIYGARKRISANHGFYVGCLVT